MKNILFTDRIKCLLGNECNSRDVQETKIQSREVQSEATESKLDFQLFDLDGVFGN